MCVCVYKFAWPRSGCVPFTNASAPSRIRLSLRFPFYFLFFIIIIFFTDFYFCTSFQLVSPHSLSFFFVPPSAHKSRPRPFFFIQHLQKKRNKTYSDRKGNWIQMKVKEKRGKVCYTLSCNRVRITLLHLISFTLRY